MIDINVTEQDVKDAILNLKKNKATGPDLIHNKLLIKAVNIISRPLSNYFNRCMDESKYPTLWKEAYVTPVHKKGDRELCSNYRPISLLSCVGKVFERCLHKHIYNFFTDNNLITEAQSGFRSGDSTINQLLSIYNSMCANFDLGLTTQSIYFDISKAFDRVWHKGLLHKLNSVGIRGKLLKLIENYLQNRTQIVTLKNEKSFPMTVPAGVPQGSVLGPLFFLVFINDIVNNICSVIKLFADDTSMSHSDENPVRRAEVLNADLRKIEHWSHLWKVKFNDTKTELLTIKRRNEPVHPLYFGVAQLDESSHHKHLGIILQNNCKWDEYIICLSGKIKLLLNCLKSFKHKLNRKTLEIMYKSFVLPLFDYADILYDSCTQYQANILENLHLEGLRTITGLVKGTSHEKLYAESGLCSLKARREKHKLIMYYKIVNGLVPQYLLNLLPPLVSELNPYHRRRPLERHVTPHRTEIYRNSFFISTTMLWNSLPENVLTKTSISTFKNYLNKDDSVVPSYYYLGNRKEQIIHCRLRHNMSDLNGDLFLRHLSNNSLCACGSSFESAEHFLLQCPCFVNVRNTTLLTLRPELLTLQNLLFGNVLLINADNEYIFSQVHMYITLTNRFE